MNEKKPIKNMTLRFPESLNTVLKHKAIDNRRSLNNEIIARLEQSLRSEAQTVEQ